MRREARNGPMKEKKEKNLEDILEYQPDAVEIEACLADLSVLDGAEVVFLSNVSSGNRNEILKYCVARGVQVYMTPRIGDTSEKSRPIANVT